MINPTKEQLIKDLLKDNNSYLAIVQWYSEKIKAQTTQVIKNAYSSTYENWAKALQDYADLLRMISLKREFESDISKNLEEIARLRHAQ